MTGAVAQGNRELVAIAVATSDGGSPCGICRQVMFELGPNMVVYISTDNQRLSDDNGLRIATRCLPSECMIQLGWHCSIMSFRGPNCRKHLRQIYLKPLIEANAYRLTGLDSL